MSEGTAPGFSIVVPAYNAAGTLSETLDAILAQQHADWECVIVDDGSTDGTMRVARDYERRDRRLRVVHQGNAGTASAYNTAVAAASGAYVVMCSADDILLPEALSTFSEYVSSNPGYDIYSSNGYFWRPGERRDLVDVDDLSNGPHSKALADVIRKCFYSVGAVFRRGLLEEIGGFRLGVFGEDYDFWLRAMARGARHRYLPKPLSLHRVSAAQKSAQVEAMYRSDIRIVSELKRDFPLSDAEIEAVAACIRERERLIAQLHQGVRQPVRVVVERIAVGLLGYSRARRVWRVIRPKG